MKPRIGSILLEACLVAVIGAGVSLAANQFSPRGLKLSRNYYPTGAPQTTAPVAVAPPATNASPATAEPSAASLLSERLRGKGLQEISRPDVEKLSRDPRLLAGIIVMIDARDPEHFQAGHIPGAYELDPYHPELQLPVVLPACQIAEQIVVYCTGGECEDADTAALLLRDAGVPAKKIFVYGGGFDEWHGARLPLERGDRNSGLLLPP